MCFTPLTSHCSVKAIGEVKLLLLKLIYDTVLRVVGIPSHCSVKATGEVKLRQFKLIMVQF